MSRLWSANLQAFKCLTAKIGNSQLKIPKKSLELLIVNLDDR